MQKRRQYRIFVGSIKSEGYLEEWIYDSDKEQKTAPLAGYLFSGVISGWQVFILRCQAGEGYGHTVCD